MSEVEERRAVRFDVIQRQNIKVDIGDFSVSIGRLVTQDAFGLKPVESRRFTHYHEQIIRRRVAVRRAACQFAEQQDVFGIEISVESLRRLSTRFAMQLSFRELWFAQAVPARCFDSFPF